MSEFEKVLIRLEEDEITKHNLEYLDDQKLFYILQKFFWTSGYESDPLEDIKKKM